MSSNSNFTDTEDSSLSPLEDSSYRDDSNNSTVEVSNRTESSNISITIKSVRKKRFTNMCLLQYFLVFLATFLFFLIGCGISYAIQYYIRKSSNESLEISMLLELNQTKYCQRNQNNNNNLHTDDQNGLEIDYHIENPKDELIYLLCESYCEGCEQSTAQGPIYNARSYLSCLTYDDTAEGGREMCEERMLLACINRGCTKGISDLDCYEEVNPGAVLER